MYPILLHLGKINIYSHGVMMILGMAIGGYIAYRFAKIHSLKTELLWDTIIWSVLFGIIGARVLYILLYPEQFLVWQDFFSIWNGGMVSYGGMVGGIVAAIIFLRHKKQPILFWFDATITGLLAGWAVGRVGCFLDSDDLGLATNSVFGVWGRWPTPLFESVALVLAVILMFFLFLRFNKTAFHGLFFSLGIMLYAVLRFFVDITKAEDMILGPLKYGQVGALILFVAGGLLLAILAVSHKKMRKENKWS